MQAGSQGEVEDWIKVIHLGKASIHGTDFMVILIIAVYIYILVGPLNLQVFEI